MPGRRASFTSSDHQRWAYSPGLLATPRTRPPVAPPAVLPAVPAPVPAVAVVPEEGVVGLGLELPVCAETEASTEPGRLTESREPRPDEAETPDWVDPPT